MSHMRMLRLMLVVAAAAACSSAPALISRSAEVSPPKPAAPSFVAGDRKVFAFWSSGAASADDAHRLAFNNAVGQAGKELGVTVEGGSESYEREQNGVYSYRFVASSKTRQVPVFPKGIRVDQHYDECLKAAGEISCDV